jgi:hypothetical protein
MFIIIISEQFDGYSVLEICDEYGVEIGMFDREG